MQRDELNNDWLNNALLDYRGQSAIIEHRVTDIGAGVGFGGQVLRVNLTYDKASPGPESIVLKLPVDDPEMLAAVKAQGLHKEAWFYQKFASDVPGLPKIYHVETSPGGFAIVMQDLGIIGPAVDAFAGHSQNSKDAALLTRKHLDHASICIQAIAKVHATYWNKPPSEAWLRPFTDGDPITRRDSELRILSAISRLEEASEIDGVQYLRDCARKLAGLISRAPDNLNLPKPVTLIHGDFHADNLQVSEDRVTIFDWQLVGSGAPMMDVANFIASSIPLSANDTATPVLLEKYSETLHAHGINDFTNRALTSAYRDARFFIFLKFLIIFGTINYNDGGAKTMKIQMINKLVFLAKQANAKSYCRKLSVLFFLGRLFNLLTFRETRD